MIRSGKVQHLRPPFCKGDWLFIDLGFSNTQGSNGVAPVSNHEELYPELEGSFQYGELIKRLQTLIAHEGPTLNIVLEAPLSMAFDEKGNPIGRSMEKEGGQHRYWYTGPGGPLVTAADHLIRKIGEPEPDRKVRIFEGFVSFKGNSDNEEEGHENESNHKRDADRMRKLLMEKDADLQVYYEKSILLNRGHELIPIPALRERTEHVPPILFVESEKNENDREQGRIYFRSHPWRKSILSPYVRLKE